MVNENGKSAAENREFDETCERYLLGELPESEREQFEEAYFADDELFERYLAVKEELLDLYARGELPKEKQARFAMHFQSTAQLRRQVNETKDFIRTVTLVSTKDQGANPEVRRAQSKPSSPKSLWQSLAGFFRLNQLAMGMGIAALLLVAVIGTWFNFQNRQPDSARNALPPIQQEILNEQTNQQPIPVPTDITQTDKNNNVAPISTPGNSNRVLGNVNRTPNNTNQISANIKQSPVNKSVTPKPTPTKPIEQSTQVPQTQIASILLLPFASRSINETNILRLNAETQTIQLELSFNSEVLRNYSATITTIGGGKIFQQEELKAMVKMSAGEANKSVRLQSVGLQLDPKQLRQQDYIVTLKGKTEDGKTETIAEYYFRVERNPK